MSKKIFYPRVCPYCSKPFQAKSKNAIYCSDGCRVMAYKVRHNIPLPQFLIKEIANRIPSKTEMALTERTSELQRIQVLVNKYQVEEEKKLDNILKPLNYELKKILERDPRHFQPPSYSIYLNEQDNVLKEYFDSIGHYEKAKEIRAKGGLALFDTIYKDKEERNEILKTAKEYVVKHYHDKINNIIEQSKKSNKAYIEARERADRLTDEISALHKGYSVERLQSSGKLIDTNDLFNIKYDLYEFSEGFENVLGHPDKNFVAMIHGSAGSGKSSFAIKFASYFSNNFGSVCYLPIEEGTKSFTFMKKIEQYAIYGGFKLIEETLPSKIQKLSESHSLIVIDSVSHLQFNVNDVEEIIRYRRNTNTSFLFVFHDTKEESYKGEASFGHLVDINLKAFKGTVTSEEKNRYKLNKLEQYSYTIFKE